SVTVKLSTTRSTFVRKTGFLASWPESHHAPPARSTTLDRMIVFDGIFTRSSARLLQSRLLLAPLELSLGADIIADHAQRAQQSRPVLQVRSENALDDFLGPFRYQQVELGRRVMQLVSQSRP